MKLTTENTEAATPETDDQPTINAINDNGYQVPCVDIEYARKLERERDEEREALSSIHRWIERNHADGFIDSLTYLQNLERVTDCWYDRIDKIERERDEAREELQRAVQERHDFHWELIDAVRERNEARDQVKELIYIAGRAIDLADLDFENDKFGVVSELRDGLEKIQEGAK